MRRDKRQLKRPGKAKPPQINASFGTWPHGATAPQVMTSRWLPNGSRKLDPGYGDVSKSASHQEDRQCGPLIQRALPVVFGGAGLVAGAVADVG